MSNIDEPDVEEEEGGQGDLLAGDGPVGRVTGYPPGNPNHISPGEAELRKKEEKAHGKDVAATRAWARATEHRAKKGGNPKHQAAPGGKAKPTTRPRQATDFDQAPLEASIRQAAKVKTTAETKMWAARVQLGSAIVCAKVQRPDMVLTDEEAQLATEAVIDLLDFYGLLKKKKLGPWGNVAYAALIIGGPRIAKLVMERLAANQTPQPQAQG